MSVDAYIVCSIRVGAFVQEQLNHLQMTMTSGAEQGGVSILSTADKQQQTMRQYHRQKNTDTDEYARILS